MLDAAANEIRDSKGEGMPVHVYISPSLWLWGGPPVKLPSGKFNCGTRPGLLSLAPTGTTVSVAGVTKADNGSNLAFPLVQT